MSHQFSFDPELPYVLLKAIGPITPESFLAQFRELVKHPQWRPGMNLLSDYSEAEVHNVSTDDVHRMATDYAAIAPKLGPGRSALVASESLKYGLARMWVSWTEMKIEREVRVFLTKDEALEWLNSEEDDADKQT